MHRNKTFSSFFLLLLPSLIVFLRPAHAQEAYADLREAMMTQAMLNGSQGPENVKWIDRGKRFSYSRTTSTGREIRSLNPESGEEELIFNAKGLYFPGTKTPFSYLTFQWSKDSKFLLFQSNFRAIWRRSGISDYYYFDLNTREMKLVAKDARSAELSPDGNYVGYEREGELFVLNLVDKKEMQLTHDAKPQVYNGHFGWAYEEEFGLAQAWTWSPDSKYIAYWQIDERKVPVFQMTDYADQHPEYIHIPYPKVGDRNPQARIGVVTLEGNQQQWMKVPLDKGYIPRIYWTARTGQLAVVHLNRAQNHLSLYFCNAQTGEGKVILEEKSESWIDIFDFFAPILHLFNFPENEETFFWISDRDGWSHIYRYDYQGKLMGQVTKGAWEVTRIEAIDTSKKKIFYSSTESSPLERHLYTVNYNGKGKKQLTEGAGLHLINCSPGGQYFIDSYSNIETPTQVSLYTGNKKQLRLLEENKGVQQFVRKRTYSKKELFRFTTEEGQSLDGYLIKPPHFDENKQYPLVLNIYGGPGAQSVYNSFANNAWEQYLVQQGYVVASVNNRGSGGYGSQFEKVVYRQLGFNESSDFVATARFLAEKPWIDGDHMAIRGHSYGGFMATFTMLNYPGVFKVALVGAPVTDWRLYDSIYTERYMGLLSDNKKGYIKSASSSYAARLEGKMFIAHSAMDENVHLQNTLQLVKALIDNGKDHDLRIYPPGNHRVAYSGVSQVLLYQQYTDYLNAHLKP